MARMVTFFFHSVGLERYAWVYPHISVSLEYFEKFIRALHDADLRTDFFIHRKALGASERSVILTFDDGYLDNWVHAFPLLQRYGIKATIFVNPEFVDTRDIVRPRRDEIPRDDDHDPRQCCAGFLSWAEMREMERSGLIDVQSHASSHTWYFSGPSIVDFWHPGAATERNGPIWMLWNRFPDFKPFYLTEAREYEGRIPYGTPIYEHGKALVTRRYYPDGALDELLPAYVADNGAEEFFRRRSWRQDLQKAARELLGAKRAVERVGALETEDEYLERIRRELTASKEAIERNLGKTIEAICWPGGGLSETVLDIAREVGYVHGTLPSAWSTDRMSGTYSNLVPRVGPTTTVQWRGRTLGIPTTRELCWRLKARSGSRFHMGLHRIIVMLRIVRYYGDPRRWLARRRIS